MCLNTYQKTFIVEKTTHCIIYVIITQLDIELDIIASGVPYSGIIVNVHLDRTKDSERTDNFFSKTYIYPSSQNQTNLKKNSWAISEKKNSGSGRLQKRHCCRTCELFCRNISKARHLRGLRYEFGTDNLYLGLCEPCTLIKQVYLHQNVPSGRIFAYILQKIKYKFRNKILT